MKLLVTLTTVAMVMAAEKERKEKPKAQNRQMGGFMPGLGGGGFPGYMGSMYHPMADPSMMGMAMQVPRPAAMGMPAMGMPGMGAMPGMGMGMGMPGMGSAAGAAGGSPGGQMMYQPSPQQGFMSPYQQQGGQAGGMYMPPLRVTQYPAISHYGAPQLPQHSHPNEEEGQAQNQGEAGAHAESEGQEEVAAEEEVAEEGVEEAEVKAAAAAAF